MSVIAVQKDAVARTLTMTAEFDATLDRVWRLWSDPRQLERWWGPPEHPATVTAHDLRAGGEVAYFVTGSDGHRVEGRWRILAVDVPRRLEFELCNRNLPTVKVSVEIAERDEGGARMATTMRFASDAAMEEMLSIGFDQGMRTAIEQAARALRR